MIEGQRCINRSSVVTSVVFAHRNDVPRQLYRRQARRTVARERRIVSWTMYLVNL